MRPSAGFCFLLLLSSCCPSLATTASIAANWRDEEWMSPDADDGDLTPLSSGTCCPDTFDELVRAKLLGDLDASISMICIPSFGPEYAIVLLRRSSGDLSPLHGFEDSEFGWSVAILQAAKQLWPVWNEAPQPPLTSEDLVRRIPVRCTTVPLDTATASAILDAWEQVVSRARYHRPAVRTNSDGDSEHVGRDTGCDGETYTFRARHYCGEAWSPRRGLAGGLVRLTDQLVELASLSESERESQLRTIREMAMKLFDAAQRKPW